MKLISHILRILTGLLFLFSGFVKLNDPTGFKIKLEEYFTVFQSDLSGSADTLTIYIAQRDSGKGYLFAKALTKASRKTLSMYTAPWNHAEEKSNDGSIRSQYDRSTFHVLLDGIEIYQAPIVKYTVSPAFFDVSVKVGTDKILSKSVPIYNNVEVRTEEPFDLSPYKRTPGFIERLLQLAFPHALLLAMLICVLEILAGMSLLIGWKKNLTLWMLALMMVFFTFLTGYSAYYDKVTDCGCFGNAIPLTPWQSFVKDLLLCVSIAILIVLRRFIVPLFSHRFSFGILTFTAMLSIVFTVYCWFFLPVFNFLKFKEGNNVIQMRKLPEGAREEVREMVFTYLKKGREYTFTADELNTRDIINNPDYVFKSRQDKILRKGDKPEIYNFTMLDEYGADHADEFLNDNAYKLLLVSEDLTQTRPRVMKKIAGLARDWTEQGHLKFWALTSSSRTDAEAIRHEFQFVFKFHYGDHTALQSIIRSNPGLLLFKKGTIIKTWPSTNLPKYKTLKKLMKEPI